MPTDAEFGTWLRDISPKLRARATKFVHTPHEVADLVQETLTRGWRGRAQFTNDFEALIGWLYTIMRHAHIEGRRGIAADSERRSSSIDDSMVRIGTESETGIDKDVRRATSAAPSQENHISLLQAVNQLKQLSPRQQAVMNLVVEEMDYPEMSERLGVTPQALKHQVSAARKAMREERTVRGRKRGL